MKRFLLLLISIISLASVSWADQINRDQALRKAQQFLSQKGLSRSLTLAETSAARARAKGNNAQDYYYIFNAGQNQGFVIVSGDDSTEEILGYSTSGSFELDNMPPAMEALLNYYSAQISMIQRGLAQAAPKRASHPAVSPFMTVKWNQREPYNGKTPLGYYSNRTEGYHCVTGCVATAMAQVLYHQKFVESTQAEIAGYKNQTAFVSKSGTKEVTIPTIPQGSALDWANMVDSYNGSETQAQKDAVANLMLYCGAAVNMNYRLPEMGGSSASNSSIPEAFKKYFGYSKGTRYISRSHYSDDDWDNIIYNEIAAGRPVIYGGQTQSNSGHAFIVHGYDGNGRYAINWGWGGYQDNYFTLDNLTPDDQGTGGGAVGEGYNFNQDAIIDLSKDDGSFSEKVRLTTEYMELNDNNVFQKNGLQFPISFKAKFVSRLANTYDISYNFAVYKDGVFMEYLKPNGAIGTFSSFTNNHYFPGNGVMEMYLPYYDGVNLYNAFKTPGTYKMVPVSREASATEWLENEGSDKYYLTAVCTDTQLTLYVGEPTNTSEVTDAQRNDLKKKLEDLKNSIKSKTTKQTANVAEITSLETSLSTASSSVSELNTKLAAIEKIVADSKLLSDAQKNDLNSKIADLKAKKTQLEQNIQQIKDKLTAAKTANDNLRKQLDEALAKVNEQIAGVSNITTTSALDAANAKVTELSTLIAAINADNVESDINNLKTILSELDINTLSNTATTIENAFNDALKKAEEELKEKERKEFEAAKANMTSKIDAISKTLTEKQSQIDANNKSIADLKTAIATASEAAKSVSDKITAIKKKLENELLTDAKKTEYQKALSEQEGKLKEYTSALSELSSKLAERAAENTSLKTKLDEAKKKAAEAQAAVNAATKKADVDALASNVDAIEKTAADINVSAVTSGVVLLEEAFKILSTEAITTALTDLEKTVDKAIADAAAAAQDEKERKELEAAKASMTSKMDAISKTLTDKQSQIDANSKSIADLKTAIATASEAAKSVSDKISAIKKKLENELLTDAKKTEYQKALSDQETALKTYTTSLSDLTNKLVDQEKENSTLKTKLDEAKKKLSDAQSAVNAATKKADVEAQASNVDAIDKAAADINVSAVTSGVSELSKTLKTLSTDAITTALADLEKTVDKAIADAEAAKEKEEKEREKAEKLAKAKEACKTALSSLTDVITKNTEKYADIQTNINKLTEKLNEIDGFINDFKAKAKKISDMIAELKPSSSIRTRATDAEIKNFEDALAKINAQIGKLEESKKDVEEKIDSIEKGRTKINSKLDEATALRDKVQASYADATVIEDVEALTKQVTDETAALNAEDGESINAVIAKINTLIAMVDTEVDRIINNDVANIKNETESLNETVTAGISGMTIDESDIQGRYDLNGRPVDANYKGVVIIRMTNGKTKTIMKR